MHPEDPLLDYQKIIDHFNVTVLLRPIRQYGCRGVTQKLSSSYTVLIDDAMASTDDMMKILTHELLHIILGHFDEYSYLSEDEKEEEINDMIKAM